MGAGSFFDFSSSIAEVKAAHAFPSVPSLHSLVARCSLASGVELFLRGPGLGGRAGPLPLATAPDVTLFKCLPWLYAILGRPLLVCPSGAPARTHAGGAGRINKVGQVYLHSEELIKALTRSRASRRADLSPPMPKAKMSKRKASPHDTGPVVSKV